LGRLMLIITIGGLMSVATGQQAIDVGNQKQLFIDDRFIESSENVALTMNPPRKVGPVLVGEHEWEVGWVSSGTVLEDNGVFKMWYSAHEVGKNGKLGPGHNCYATSTDGIHWEKPNLGLVEFKGSKDNNIIAAGGTVFIDPKAPADQRYKMLCQMYWPDPEKGGLYIRTSPDGLKWTPHETRLLPFVPDTQNQVFYDPRIDKYVAYIRTWAPLRKVGRIEMDDCMKPWPFTPLEKPYHIWGQDKIPVPSTEFHQAISYDEFDPVPSDHYTPAVVQYPWAADAYFAFPSAYLHFPEPPEGKYNNDGLLDIQLFVSRDGVTFHRIERGPYIALSPEGAPDSKCLYMNVGMLRVGDELYQYYVGFHHSHGEYVDWPELKGMGAICLVVQRLDGFVSADAAWGGGALTTPPITFEGSKLELNINCSAMGTARVELRDADDNPIEGFTLADADIIYGNNVHKIVTWKGNPDVSALAGKPIKLHFKMRAAKLYAFQFLQ